MRRGAPGRLALALLVLCVWAGAATARTPEIHPFQAGPQSLSGHLERGVWTLVMFWSLTCEICAAETPALSAFHEAEGEEGVRLLGVSIDGARLRAPVAGWMERHGMTFPSLLGELPEVAAYFSGAAGEPFRGTPSFLLFDPGGQLVGVNAGPVRVEAVRRFIERRRADR